MKTQEEIEQLADEYATSNYGYSNENHNAYLDCKKHCIDFYTQCQNDMLHDQTVTRFEVIEQLADEYATSNYGYSNENHNAYLDCKKHCIDFYTQCQNDMLHDQTVTRFEVIDENGRVYVAKDCKVELSYQDDGRTLKVFIKK